MSNNAEQYTVKTPEDAYYKHYTMWCRDDHKTLPDAMIDAIKEYSSELIKENERLRGTIGVECVKQLLEAREENSELLKYFNHAVEWIEERHGETHDSKIYKSVLSKFQPKKDESHDEPIKER